MSDETHITEAPAAEAPSKNNWLANFVAWAIALLGAGVTAFLTAGSLEHFGTVNDLPEYYAAAQLFAQNRAAEIYNLDKFFVFERELFPMLTRGVGLFLPPLAVPLLLPLCLLPIAVAPQVWTALLAIALVTATFLLGKYFGMSRNALAWLLGLVLLSGPAGEALRIGQLAPLLLLALVAFMHFCKRDKWFAAGVALAFFVLKPQQMFPLVIYLLGAGQYRKLSVAAGVAIALSLISFLFFGVDGYMAYLQVVTDKGNLAFMQPELNPTVRGQTLRLVGYASSLPTIAGIVSLLASAVFAFLLGRKWKRSKVWLEAGLVGAMPLGLVTSMHCHDYDLLLLVPSLVSMISLKSLPIGRYLPWLAGLAAVTFLQPFYADIHYGFLLKSGSPVNPHFVALMVFAIYAAWLAWNPRSASERASAGWSGPSAGAAERDTRLGGT